MGRDTESARNLLCSLRYIDKLGIDSAGASSGSKKEADHLFGHIGQHIFKNLACLRVLALMRSSRHESDPDKTPTGHWRVEQLATEWSYSPSTIIRLFSKEPDVLRLSNEGSGKRTYTCLSIPPAAADRVQKRLSDRALQPVVVTLDHTKGDVTEKGRNIIKLPAFRTKAKLRLPPKKKLKPVSG